MARKSVQASDDPADKSAHPAWHGDEHHGSGGSYLFDPLTGKRSLVERTKIPTAAPTDGEAQPEAKE